jgi:hypothetical protein
MIFMNSWEIERAVSFYEAHPILGPASRTLQNLERWTNANSDGWAYWPKPCRAAAKLQELLSRGDTWLAPPPTDAEYKAALRPVKSFRTRHGADFEIVEVVPLKERQRAADIDRYGHEAGWR